MKSYLLLICFYLFSNFCFSQWSPQVSGTNQQFWSLDFVNANTGYATTDNGYTVKTTDGGVNWNVFPSFTGTFLEFVSADTAFGFVIDTAIHFQKSTNGGLNWSTKLSCSGGFGRFHFPNSSTGYLSGFSSDLDSLIIYKSIDAGENWNPILGYYLITPIYGSIYFQTPSTGYYSNEIGELYRTTNGGSNWNLVFTTSMGSVINSIDFPSLLIGYAATDVSFLKTTNGGISWTESATPFSGAYLDIECTDDNTCYMIGGDGFSTGTLLKTTNGGTNWIQTSTTCDLLWDVDFVNDTIGYTCGLDGTILKYQSTGSSSLEEPTFENFALYPNPAKDFVNVSFENITDTELNAIIYNSLGQVAKRFAQYDSDHKKFDLEDLPSGLYTIQFYSSNKKYRSKRFIIE